MLLVPPVCLPVPNCCKKSAWFTNRRGFGSSGKYGLCTLRSAGCCAFVPAAAAAVEIDTIRKPVVDKAVIVGGGLGGLAAAIQLRKVGIDAQVWPLFLSSSFDPWPPSRQSFVMSCSVPVSLLSECLVHCRLSKSKTGRWSNCCYRSGTQIDEFGEENFLFRE